MLRLVLLLIAYIICCLSIEAGALNGAELSGYVPNRNTPRILQQAWLSFHETDLCQEVDALFVFNKNGMEVWSRIESDRALQRFQELLDPAKNSSRVELYTTRPLPEKKRDDEDDPPPSLWLNYELRANLGDRLAVAVTRQVLDEQLQKDPLPADSLLKQRLQIYAEQILDWSERMERYALDLPALARIAFDAGEPPDLESRANAVCAAHARNLEKYVKKLTAQLEQAIPISERKKRASSAPEKSVLALKAPLERAEHISEITQGVSQRIYRFINPEHYTVELDELRHPSLLEDLASLRGIISDFRKSLSRPVRNQTSTMGSNNPARILVDSDGVK